MQITDALNALPRLTYRWLNLNDYQLKEKVAFPSKPFPKAVFSGGDAGSLLLREIGGESQIEYLKRRSDFGVSRKLVSFAENSANGGFYLEVPSAEEVVQPIHILYTLNEEEAALNGHHIIVARKNSTSTVIINYQQEGKKAAYHNGVTKVFAEEGAHLTLIKMQCLGEQAFHFDSYFVEAGSQATVKFIQVELGGRFAFTNYLAQLAANATATVNTAYFGDGKRVLDLSYQMVHRGYQSKSQVLLRGALQDQARKVFRGTLDFQRGARLAQGSEEEYVILLDADVKAAAIPLLLSAEDDVQGEHAASAGRIDEEQLFYLQSRGLEKGAALKTLVLASLNPVFGQLPQAIQEQARQELGRRLMAHEL